MWAHVQKCHNAFEKFKRRIREFTGRAGAKRRQRTRRVRATEGSGNLAGIYRSKMGHDGNKLNFQTYIPLNFIAPITEPIPERLAQMVRQYGWYSNRIRGDR